MRVKLISPPGRSVLQRCTICQQIRTKTKWCMGNSYALAVVKRSVSINTWFICQSCLRVTSTNRITTILRVNHRVCIFSAKRCSCIYLKGYYKETSHVDSFICCTFFSNSFLINIVRWWLFLLCVIINWFLFVRAYFINFFFCSIHFEWAIVWCGDEWKNCCALTDKFRRKHKTE